MSPQWIPQKGGNFSGLPAKIKIQKGLCCNLIKYNTNYIIKIFHVLGENQELNKDKLGKEEEASGSHFRKMRGLQF